MRTAIVREAQNNLPSELAPGTLRKLIRLAGASVEQFRAALA